MGNEVSVSAILIEEDDGTYTASCPEFDMAIKGGDPDEAIAELKEAVTKRIREAGGGVQMKSVKCMKFKVSVE
ncbi:MAG: hypothetical protein Q8P48_06700 [Deltaproteobacteria bacterium]|nr:hypothetical protein [Deltaproteobacteria bacterium]